MKAFSLRMMHQESLHRGMDPRCYISGQESTETMFLRSPFLEIAEKESFRYLEDVQMPSLQPQEVQLFEHIVPRSLGGGNMHFKQSQGKAEIGFSDSCCGVTDDY